MQLRLLTTISLGFLAAACASQYDSSARVPGSAGPAYVAVYSTSEQACADYGFGTGSVGFDRCVSRERAVRANGRVGRDYTEARLNAEARDTCSSYGIEPGTMRYDRCVGREVDARSYRDGAPAASYAPAYPQPGPNYRTDQYGNRYDSEGYRLDANGYRMQRAADAAPNYPAVGTPVTRDEFGFRYDSYGNRVDARGRVINPQER